MIKKHLKRLTMPKSWPIKRKGIMFTTRPNPGKNFKYTLPLVVVLRDLLKKGNTAREVKFIVKEKQVLIDGKRVTEIKYPVGLMDVVSFPDVNEDYRILLTTKGKLTANKIEKAKAKIKVTKIVGKTMIGKKIQLNLFDSRNIIIDKDMGKVSDSVIIEVPEQKISKVLALKKDAYVMLIAGNYMGHHGLVENIGEKNIIINLSDGSKIETSKDYAYVLGEKNPEIDLK